MKFSISLTCQFLWQAFLSSAFTDHFISLDSERDYLHGLGFKEKFVTQAS